MNFGRGQKVVCVKPSRDLVEGEVYTVSSCFGDEAVTVVEVSPTDGCIAFWQWRFKPIDDKWADDVLKKIIQKINADKLQLETLIPTWQSQNQTGNHKSQNTNHK